MGHSSIGGNVGVPCLSPDFLAETERHSIDDTNVETIIFKASM